MPNLEQHHPEHGPHRQYGPKVILEPVGKPTVFVKAPVEGSSPTILGYETMPTSEIKRIEPCVSGAVDFQTMPYNVGSVNNDVSVGDADEGIKSPVLYQKTDAIRRINDPAFFGIPHGGFTEWAYIDQGTRIPEAYKLTIFPSMTFGTVDTLRNHIQSFPEAQRAVQARAIIRSLPTVHIHHEIGLWVTEGTDVLMGLIPNNEGSAQQPQHDLRITPEAKREDADVVYEHNISDHMRYSPHNIPYFKQAYVVEDGYRDIDGVARDVEVTLRVELATDRFSRLQKIIEAPRKLESPALDGDILQRFVSASYSIQLLKPVK